MHAAAQPALTFRDASATEADSRALAQIGAVTFVETFGHLYRREDLDAFLAADHSPAAARAFLGKPAVRVRFALQGDVVMGYVAIAPNALPHVPADLRAAELKRLYLRPALQGQGVADALMDWAEATARADGWDAMSLSVFSDNHRAKRFYARRGFAHLGDYHFMVGTQADCEHVWLKHLA
jgi:ribosomal protein S18 acetylase RimI-like enzyme